MTRINVGINPEELCDLHLLAEYRELPRLWGKTSKTPAPNEFKLGTGHVLWCQQFQGMLHDRYTSIVREMRFRGFNVSFPSPPEEAMNGMRPTDNDIKIARPLLIERIKERLSTMKRKPIWTNRPEGGQKT